MSEKQKRQRCKAMGPRPFMVCGRWKGHEGHHREMNDPHEWLNDEAPIISRQLAESMREEKDAK